MIVLTLGVCWIVAMTFAVAAYASQRIELNTNGLRYRNLSGWRNVPWADVTDFYAKWSGSNAFQSAPEGIIVVKSGPAIRFGYDWFGMTALSEVIVREVGEQCEVRDWLPIGRRSRDFPFAFTYRKDRLAVGYRTAIIAVCVLVAICIGLPVSILVVLLRGSNSTPLIELMAIFTLFIGNVSCVTLNPFWDAFRRVGAGFTAQRDGFVYHDGREDTFVAWGAVIGYDFTASQAATQLMFFWQPIPLFRIRTEAGQEFVFTDRLDNALIWQSVVRKYAVNGIESKINYEHREALGGVGLCWTGRTEGIGDRVFHQQTRTQRGSLFLVPFVALLPLCPLFMNAFGLSEVSCVLPVMGLVACALWEGYLIWQYYVNRLVLSAEGVHIYRPFRESFIAYSDIDSVKEETYRIRLQKAGVPDLVFTPTNHAFGSRILPLIEDNRRRANDARNVEGIQNAER